MSNKNLEKDFSVKYAYNFTINKNLLADVNSKFNLTDFDNDLSKLHQDLKLIILKKLNDFIEDNSKYIDNYSVKSFVGNEKITTESYELPDQDFSKVMQQLDLPKGNL
jgi:hypothetical protein